MMKKIISALQIQGISLFIASMLAMEIQAVDIIVGIPSLNPNPGEEFQIDITLEMGPDVLGSYVFNFKFDPAVVNVVDIDGGLTSEFGTSPLSNPTMFSSGETIFAASQPSMTSPAGFVSVAQITLLAVGEEAESSNLDIEVISMNDGNAQAISDISRPALGALSICTDPSNMTAGGNDIGFENVFARNVEGLGRPGDVLIGISTSGNSENVRRAVAAAHKTEMKTICLLGGSGGSLKNECTVPIVVPSHNVQRIQETHITLGHVICESVEHELYGTHE